MLFRYILCTISLAIVLYGWAYPHRISSFICCHEDTCAEHLTKKYRRTKRIARANVTLNHSLRLAGNVCISGHSGGGAKTFSSDCLVTEKQIKNSKCCNFRNFLREIKDKFVTIWRFINAFTLSPLNGVSSRFFMNHIDNLICLMPSNTFRKIVLNETSSWL